MKPKTLAAVAAAVLLSGCAHYATDQTNTTYDSSGKPTRTTATRVSITTFADSESEVMNSKILSTEKTQSAQLGSLGQSASGTNIVEGLKQVRAILELMAMSAK